MNKKIDFNCDLAQSFGIYKQENETDFTDYVTSANISCGFHAGDPKTIKDALILCREKNIAVGAHIGFQDIQGFGYREMDLDNDELESLIIYQLSAISSFAKTVGVEIEHVRPHGAMYIKAMQDFDFAYNVANAIYKFDKWLIYVGASGELLENISAETNLRVAHEVFLDKHYNVDGKIDLTKQNIESSEFSINRFNSLMQKGEILLPESKTLSLKADTIHFSTKNKYALDIIKTLRKNQNIAPLNYSRVAMAGWVE